MQLGVLLDHLCILLPSLALASGIGAWILAYISLSCACAWVVLFLYILVVLILVEAIWIFLWQLMPLDSCSF